MGRGGAERGRAGWLWGGVGWGGRVTLSDRLGRREAGKGREVGRGRYGGWGVTEQSVMLQA